MPRVCFGAVMSKQTSLISYFNKPKAIPAIDNGHRINTISDDEDSATECDATASIAGHSASEQSNEGTSEPSSKKVKNKLTVVLFGNMILHI